MKWSNRIQKHKWLLLLFLLVSCSDLPHEGNGYSTVNKNDSVKVIAETKYASLSIYKAVIDGQEYLIVHTPNGVSVVSHHPK